MERAKRPGDFVLPDVLDLPRSVEDLLSTAERTHTLDWPWPAHGFYGETRSVRFCWQSESAVSAFAVSHSLGTISPYNLRYI